MSRNIEWNASLWRSRFFSIWTGQVFSLLGSELVQFALVWWLTRTTGSATVLAGATLVALLPQILISPIAGTLVDRWDRRWVMILADGGIALTSVALAVLFASGTAQVWHVYVALLARSAGSAFHWPAMQAATAMMVPDRHLARIGGLNQGLYGFAAIVCPPLGAILLGLLPMHAILGIDVATAAVAILPLIFLRIPQPQSVSVAQARPSVFADFAAGLRFVWGWKPLLLIILVSMTVNLFTNPASALTPLLVTKHFGGGAIQLAGLQSAFGFGMVAGGALLGIWGGFKRRIVTVIVALFLMGIGFTAVGFMPSTGFGVAIAAFGFIGVMSPICDGALLAILQSTVPHEMQGRVLSLLMSGAKAAAPLGLAVAGPVADRFGIPIWYAIAGLVMVAGSLLVFVVPGVLRIEGTSSAICADARASSMQEPPE
jgi:DHA3 family macrolide efflux protein-like MFS transporter